MDRARRDEIRGRLDRPHTRDALAPLVTASELRALLDALDAAERGRDDARAEVETRSAEAALLREIIEGRITPLREPSACERCGGRRAVAKMSGPIPCPACVPPVRLPCPYCTEGVALVTGETCRECDGQGSRG
jgi:hypothetical protein